MCLVVMIWIYAWCNEYVYVVLRVFSGIKYGYVSGTMDMFYILCWNHLVEYEMDM